MTSLLHAPLKFIDGFLIHSRLGSGESRRHARMIVFYLLFLFATNSLRFVFSRFYSPIETLFLLVNSCAPALCLLLIKRSFSPEKVVTGLVFFLLTELTLTTVVGKVINANFMSIYAMILTSACFVIVSLKLRLLILFAVLLGNALCYWAIYEMSIDPHRIILYGELEDDLFKVVTRAMSITIFALITIKIRNVSQREMELEIEWQQRALRLEELSSVTKSMCFLLDRPTRILSYDIDILCREQDAASLDRIEEELSELVLVSQSLGWIYRAYRQEGASSILSTTLMLQLQVLLSSKVREKGWTLSTSHPGQPVEVFGPIPSLTLILFTVIAQIVDGPKEQQQKELSLEFQQKGSLLIWNLRWPLPFHEAEDAQSLARDEKASNLILRQELIQELTKVCKADIHKSQEGGIRQMQISGAWKPNLSL